MDNDRGPNQWPYCEQADCSEHSFASLVWPGRGRMDFCIVHFNAAVSVLNTLGVDPKSCDPKLTAGELT